jgi:phosphoenolpyruvate synthase/pyruvate phosphate dikinase
MMNVGNPDRAFAFAATPNAGVGLARLEFIINNMIGIHPKALLEYDQLPADLKARIAKRIAAYPSPREFFVTKLAEGIATLGPPSAPHTVIVRMSDFKSNEYANLIAGTRYEPEEENPMIGFRGAGRYVAESFKDCFELECEAIKRVRNVMGLTNVEIMIPFVRTLKQAKAVVEALAAQRAGARQGRPAGHHDVRDPLQRRAGGRVPGILRRLLHRLQRHDPAHPGPGPGFRPGGRALRRARSRRAQDAVHGHRGLP